jgi:hypothetical protein
MKWEETGFMTHEIRSVPAYHKGNVVGFFEINYQYGQIMVAAWRIYGTISRT